MQKRNQTQKIKSSIRSLSNYHEEAEGSPAFSMKPQRERESSELRSQKENERDKARERERGNESNGWHEMKFVCHSLILSKYV